MPTRTVQLLVAALAAALVTACSPATDTLGDTTDDAPATDADTGASDTDDDAPATVESAELLGALEEVSRLAPALESHYRGDPYPTTLDEVVASLPDADLTVADGYRLGGYVYDDASVEFTLCVEHEASGAWATYDTAPMSTRENGETGGCP